jgi:D-alanyl-lipoteichoic acid acyltransferase DltB (MBOAT superfamily)
MLFVELRFFLFFAIVFALVWTLRKNGQRKVVLTAASYIFYGVWDWRFLGLILFVTAVSYLVGTRFNTGLTDKRTQKRWLTLGVVTVLGVLGVFKYFNFFAESFADFAGLIGLPVGQITLSLVLPVGISFFTFQAISYMVDAYRGDIPAKRSFLDIAFYIAFFPQLVAGPIVRASDFIPQMETARRWADVGVRAALILFLIGFIKKACISDNIAPYVDMVFANPESFTAPAMIGGVHMGRRFHRPRWR